MIDPLGPDPNDPATPPGKPAEIVSGFEHPETITPRGPKIRHANYDSPEALIRPEGPSLHDPAPAPDLATRTVPAAQPRPAAQPEKPKPAAPPEIIPKAKLTPLPKTATTALARPIPPKPGKLERAIGVARTMLPIVGSLLPLLEGNVAGAAANFLAKRPAHEVDLKPIQEAIASLQSEQRALTFHTSEQKRAIRRIEDEFAALQESLQKYAADQNELAGQLINLARRTSKFMRLVTVLLIVSILFTTLLVVRIAYLMRS
jgi:hypothetical protein